MLFLPTTPEGFHATGTVRINWADYYAEETEQADSDWWEEVGQWTGIDGTDVHAW